MKFMKKTMMLLAAAVSAALTLTALPGASAQTVYTELAAQTYGAAAVTVGDFSYKLNNEKTVTLCGYNGSDEKIKIPSSVKINGTSCTVTAIGDNAFSKNPTASSITVPNTVTSIGRSAFSECGSLTKLTLPEKIKTIPANMCGYDSALISIDFPDSVTAIGAGAFQGCSSLKDVKMSKNLITIGNRAFYGCAALKTLHLPKSVADIGNLAFDRIGTILYEGSEKQWNDVTIDFSFGTNDVSFKYNVAFENDDPAPKPSNVKAAALSGSEIRLTWKQTDKSLTDKYQIQVYKGKVLIETVIIQNTGSTSKKTISDLNANTEYTFKITAIKGGNKSAQVSVKSTTKSK